MLDLNALESFVIAAETLNFSDVAARRNTVQSAVSAHIRKLEDAVGHPLFERGRGKAMRLTPEGRAFATYARRILALSEEAVQTLRTARSLRTIRLGTTVTLALSVVARALRRFAAAYPAVQIQILCDRSDALLARLDAGEIDLAYMMDQGKRSERLFVENAPLVWVSGPGFTLDPEADVPLVFLTDGRDLRRYAFRALDRAAGGEGNGRSGYIAHLSPHPIGVRAFVVAGLALSVMPAVSLTAPLRDFGVEHPLPALEPVGLSAYGRPGAPQAEIDLLMHLLQEESVFNDRAGGAVNREVSPTKTA